MQENVRQDAKSPTNLLLFSFKGAIMGISTTIEISSERSNGLWQTPLLSPKRCSLPSPSTTSLTRSASSRPARSLRPTSVMSPTPPPARPRCPRSSRLTSKPCRSPTRRRAAAAGCSPQRTCSARRIAREHNLEKLRAFAELRLPSGTSLSAATTSSKSILLTAGLPTDDRIGHVYPLHRRARRRTVGYVRRNIVRQVRHRPQGRDTTRPAQSSNTNVR